MRAAIIALAFLAVPAGSATAQSIQGVLTANELKKEMYGVKMEGVAGISDLPWTECIEPDGDTVYSYQGVQLVGHFSVGDDGLACFNYGEQGATSRNCFSVYREGSDGYVFSGGARNGGQFKTTSVTRNVKACPKGPPSVG